MNITIKEALAAFIIAICILAIAPYLGLIVSYLGIGALYIIGAYIVFKVVFKVVDFGITFTGSLFFQEKNKRLI